VRIQSGFGRYLHTGQIKEKEPCTRMDIEGVSRPALICVTSLWMDCKLLILNALIGV
jgi:hypothetical protein